MAMVVFYKKKLDVVVVIEVHSIYTLRIARYHIFSVSFAFLIYSSIRQLGSMSHVGVKPSHTYHSALIWYGTIHTYCGDRNDMLQREREVVCVFLLLSPSLLRDAC